MHFQAFSSFVTASTWDDKIKWKHNEASFPGCVTWLWTHWLTQSEINSLWNECSCSLKTSSALYPKSNHFKDTKGNVCVSVCVISVCVCVCSPHCQHSFPQSTLPPLLLPTNHLAPLSPGYLSECVFVCVCVNTVTEQRFANDLHL